MLWECSTAELVRKVKGEEVMPPGFSALCTVQVEKPRKKKKEDRKQTKVLKNTNKERKEKQKRRGNGGE